MNRSALGLMLAVLAGLSTHAYAQVPAPPPTAPAELTPNDYADEKNWLCRPGRKGDLCDVDLATTMVAADGTLTREAFTPNPKAPSTASTCIPPSPRTAGSTAT